MKKVLFLLGLTSIGSIYTKPITYINQGDKSQLIYYIQVPSSTNSETKLTNPIEIKPNESKTINVTNPNDVYIFVTTNTSWLPLIQTGAHILGLDTPAPMPSTIYMFEGGMSGHDYSSDK